VLVKHKPRALIGIASVSAWLVGCVGPTPGSVDSLSVPSGQTAPIRHDSSVNVLYNFSGYGPYIPTAAVVADSSGALYGTAQQGGYKGSKLCGQILYSGCGGVFKLTPSGSGYIGAMLYLFKGGSDGAWPSSPLYLDSRGDIYGTALFGGSTACPSSEVRREVNSRGCGTVFKLTRRGSAYSESTIHVFAGGGDGAEPVAGLMGDSSGVLYGATSIGGSADAGTIFSLTPKGGHGKSYGEKVLYAFKGAPKDGEYPGNTLYMDSKGALYGVTAYGGNACHGTPGCGTVFRLTSKGAKGFKEEVLYKFHGGNDGAAPSQKEPLIADGKGALYGTTSRGGNYASAYGYGTVFKLSTEGNGYKESILYRFQGYPTDGSNPFGGVIADSSGDLYGTTFDGGSNGFGTVFELSPTGSEYTESLLYSFLENGGPDNPLAGLIERSGTFYGTSELGGAYYGTVFSLSR
jgi:uncharacterized repeat protein (TIGR03803 family)